MIAVGVPYPNVTDARVAAQRDYYTDGGADGDEWYATNAFYALNQALGRVVRHKDDFGAVVLLDARYAKPDNRARISRWARDELVVRHEGLDAVSEFFKAKGM